MLDFFEGLKQDDIFLQSVRLSLGVSDDSIIGRDFILNPMFYDMAMVNLEGLIPCLYTTEFTPKELARIKLAFGLLVASLMSPSVYGMIDYEVKTIDITWKRKVIDYGALADDLYNRAKDLLRDFECFSEENDGGFLFVVAPSKRGVGCCRAPGTVRCRCGK